MANIYNEPESTNVKITLKNNVYSYLNTNIGIAKICLITDQKKFGYSDLLGNLKKCLTDASGSSLTPKNCVFIADSEGSASHSTTFVYNDNKLGVNIAVPQSKAHFHEPTTANCLIQITNSTTGSSDEYDGMTVGIVGDDNVIRTTYMRPVKIQSEVPGTPGTFRDIVTFKDEGVRGDVILDANLYINNLPTKSDPATTVLVPGPDGRVSTRTVAQIRSDIGAAAVNHTQAISTITGLQTALDSKEPAITGTANKVLSIQAGGSGVKTGSIYDDGNVALIGKTTASPGGGYKLEVEGNTLVNGTLKTNNSINNTGFIQNTGYIASIYPLSDHSIHYRDVYQYSTKTASLTGTMKFTLPLTWSSTMLAFTIKGYNWATGQGAWECVIGGYNYENGVWRNCSAEIRGTAPFSQVRLAHDGTKCCLLLGTPNTIWHYPQVAITEVFASYNYASGWGEPYSMSFITSETGIENVTVPPINIYGNSAVIPNNALIGKTTVTGDYRLEVEGNTLVTGYTASIYPSNNSVYYRDVYQYSSNILYYHEGIMKFTLPKSWTNTVLTFTIRGHGYGRDAWECIISGYNHRGDEYFPDGWYECTAEIRGFAPFSQVRLAHDGTKCCLLLGDTSTFWNSQVAITEVFASNDETSGWGEPYSISFITSETGLNSIATPRTVIYGDNDFGTVWFDYDTNVYGVSFDLIKKVKYKRIGKKIDVLYSFKKSSTALSVGDSFSFVAMGYYSSEFDDTFYSGICINSNGEQVGVAHMKPNDHLLYVTITKATNEIYGSFTFYKN